MLNESELLESTLPGQEVHRGGPEWEENFERPWKIWNSLGSNWAVYLIEGEMISRPKIESIKRSFELNVNPVVIATDKTQLAAVADKYVESHPYIVCEISGAGKLIAPLPRKFLAECTSTGVKHRTRIQQSLLRDLVKRENLPRNLKRGMNTIIGRYRKIR